MNVPLSVDDMTHIVDLLREDLAFTQMIIDSPDALEQTRSEAMASNEKSRSTLQKIAHHTIKQAYEPNIMAQRHELN